MSEKVDEMSNANAAFIINEGIFDALHSTNVSCYQCEFDNTHYEDLLFTQHEIEYAPFLNRAVIKRKAEFFAGRYAAQQAMKRLKVEKNSVGIGQHRNPVWPASLVGSITHTTTQAICAIARNTDYKSLGIDLADQISVATANNIKDQIIQTHEAETLSKLPLSFEQSLTLAFSAKESLFKALYPHVGFYFEFYVAEICEIEMKTHTFLMRLTRDLNDLLIKNMVFQGRFKMQSDTIFTSIYII